MDKLAMEIVANRRGFRSKPTSWEFTKPAYPQSQCVATLAWSIARQKFLSFLAKPLKERSVITF
jgi:hypothetical protein